jgi:DNA-binding beta-propeller fold protein YncE
MTVKQKRILILCVVAAIVLGWLAYVIAFNRRIKALDEVPVENYGIGEFVSFDTNYAYGQQLNGFEIKVLGYQISDTADYLGLYGLTLDDINYPPEKICVVDMVIKYNGDNEQAVINTSSFYMFGMDYYEGQNNEIYALANQQSGGATNIIFNKGDECELSLVYNLQKDYYTNYNWKHIENLQRKIYLTASPVQKNIILHE